MISPSQIRIAADKIACRAAQAALAASALVLLASAASAADAKFSIVPAQTYVERDSVAYKADIYLPEGKGEHPAVLVVHGGAWFIGNRAHVAWHAESLAAAGYVAVAINYRLAPRYPFPAQLEDCQAALCWMETNAQKYKIDVKRIGAFGYSAGGHLVTLLGVLGSDTQLGKCPAKERLRAVVAGGAPCDFCMLPSDNRRLAYWLGGSRAEEPSAYESASPLRFVTADDPPMCFFHGTRDELVPQVSPTAMVAKLKHAGVETELYTVEGAGHMRAYRDEQALQASIRFLDRHLKPR